MEHDPVWELGSFGNWWHFEAFCRWLEGNPEWEEIPVRHRWSQIGNHYERWFRHQPTGDVWRMVEPDAPFTGVWEKVDKSKLRR